VIVVVAQLSSWIWDFTVHFAMGSKFALIGSLYGSELVVLGRASLVSKVVYGDVLVDDLSTGILV